MPTGKQVNEVAATIMSMDEPARLRNELERAYRCIRGFYSFVQRDKSPDKTFLAYQSPTIGAAMRSVHEGALDGAAYFEGKPLAVLHDALKL